MHGDRFLPVGRSQAIGARVTTPDDHHPLTRGQNVKLGHERVTMATLILLRKEFHGLVNPFEFSSGHRQIAWLLSAARQNDGIELALQILDRQRFSYVRIGDKANPLFLHQLKAAVDDLLFQFEFRDAVAQQSTDAVGLFVHRDPMAAAVKLLSCGQPRRTRAHDRNFSSRTEFGWLRLDPAFRKSALNYVLLDILDRNWRLIDAQHTRSLARRRTYASGKLRKIIGRMQLANCFFPAPAINQIVPIRNDVVDRTSGVTERYPAIHATPALCTQLLFRKILIDLEPVVDPLRYRPALRHFAS